MGEKILVTSEDLADGARLVQGLNEEDFPITAAFWAYDSLLDVWRLIIAAPRDAIESLVTAYGKIQNIIDNRSLAVTLDRISLIPDNDAKLANLQAMARSDAPGVVEASVGRTEIGGRPLDDIHLYRNEALRYESEVIDALQRVLAPNAAVRTVNYRAEFPRSLEIDALINDGELFVIVEIKAVSRPLNSEHVFQATGKLEGFLTYFGPAPGAAMIVSRSGFTLDAFRTAEEVRFPRTKLVHWVGPQDDSKLQSALTEIGVSVSNLELRIQDS